MGRNKTMAEMKRGRGNMCIRDLLQEGIEEEEVWESEGACKVREEEQDHSLSEESILEE